MRSRKSPDSMDVSAPDKTATGDIDVTNLALDRTVLANERTYAAWIRTGLASLVTGLGIAKFMSNLMPLWGTRVIVAALIIFSAIAFLLAAWRYSHLHLKVSHLEVDTIPLALVWGLSLLFVACSLIALVSVWYLTS